MSALRRTAASGCINRFGARVPVRGFLTEPRDPPPALGTCRRQAKDLGLTCSEIVSASSTSMPRQRTVLSSLVWPSSNCTARRFPVLR